MKGSLLFFLIISLLLTKTVSAENRIKVDHSHDQRKHSHVLPNNGVGSHTHSSAKRNKETVQHKHNKKHHAHILPKSGKQHTHTKFVAKKKLVSTKKLDQRINLAHGAYVGPLVNEAPSIAKNSLHGAYVGALVAE